MIRVKSHTYDTVHNSLVWFSCADYDAILTEGGRYTEKYNITKELLRQYSVVKNIRTVEQPAENPVSAFEAVSLTEAIPLEGVRSQLTSQLSDELLSMESLELNGGSGQSYGLVWYRANITTRADSRITIRGHVRSDGLQVRSDRAPGQATMKAGQVKPNLSGHDEGMLEQTSRGHQEVRSGHVILDVTRISLGCQV